MTMGCFDRVLSQEAKFRELWSGGASDLELSERFAVSSGTVWRVKKRLGLRRAPAWTTERETELRRLWDEGVKCRIIAARFGVGVGSIVGKARRLGLPERDQRIGLKGPANPLWKGGSKASNARSNALRKAKSTASVKTELPRRKTMPGRICGIVLGYRN